ncbi:MAG TPA: LuxR C-terminal-related transcriptional regulator, partial [Rhodoglobus sp.]|nr:LuxR C-terminal-related transcriptional regulator [Rhodoglobus sp.]
ASVPAGLRQGLAALDRLDRSNPGNEFIRATLLLYLEEAVLALEAVESAAAMFGDSEPERAIVAHGRTQPLAAVGRSTEAIADGRAALRFAQQTAGMPGAPLPVTAAAHSLAATLQQSLFPAEAWDAAMLALESSTATDDEPSTRIAEFRLGFAALDAGRLDDAARWFREARSGAMSIGPASLVVPSTAMLAITVLSQGDVGAAEQLLAEIPSGIAEDPPQRVARALVAAHHDRRDEARERLLAHAREATGRGYLALTEQYLHWITRFVDAAAAAEEYAALPAAEPFAVPARHARAEAAGDRRELEAVADEWERRGALLWAAEALTSASRAALAEGDPRRAATLQTRVDRLLEHCGGAATPLLARPVVEAAGLTAREREIAALAARGLSSKQIADELFLSSRTIDNHLRSIYMKLDVRSRRELTEALS